MRDAPFGVIRAHDLVARPHEIAPGPDLDLVGETRLGQQLAEIDRRGAKRRHFAVPPGDILRPHDVDADGAGGNRHRMAVLHPEQQGLARLGRRHAGIQIGRPGIGVVGATELPAGFRETVDRVFHHVVALDADRVDEQRAGEIAQAKPLAHRAAVDADGVEGAFQRLGPFRQHGAIGAEQAEPQRRVGCAITRPVIGGDDLGMQALARPGAVAAVAHVTQEGEVGGEVDRVEIPRRIRQPVLRQPHGIQREDLAARRQQAGDLLLVDLGVKRGDQHRVGRDGAERGDRLRLQPQPGLAEVFHALHEDAGEMATRDRVEGIERLGGSQRIGVVDGQALKPGQPLHQGAGLGGDTRMAQRLEQAMATEIVARPPAIAAVGVGKGVDLQRHGCPGPPPVLYLPGQPGIPPPAPPAPACRRQV